MVRTINLNDVPPPHATATVVGLSQYAAPALSTALLAYSLTTWSTVPALLHEGASNASVADWAKNYCGLGGNTELVAISATIVAGINTALALPFKSFARFYFILGAASTSIYLLLRPYVRYKVAQISQYGNVKEGSVYPKKDLKTVLYAHLVSSLFAATGLGFFAYGLSNALNNL